MDWDMLGKMAQSGVTVGSHTRSHTLLATAPEPVVREELEGSRRALEQRLGAPVRHLAYPDGSFNAGTIRAVHAAGYLTACTTCGHGNEEFPQLALSRRLLWERACMDSFGQFSPAILSCEVNGVFDGRERCTYAH
jgi:peptidoglycan/xylan/chitin deacetylase (PgdA/CDA1 family)